MAALNANKAQAHIDTILSGAALQQYFNDPTTDSRTPDIIVLPEPGVIYTNSTNIIAAHGGFNDDDTHVALLVANPQLQAARISPTPVQTTQIAPTILRFLGLNPQNLQAVGIEHTHALPDFVDLFQQTLSDIATMLGSGGIDNQGIASSLTEKITNAKNAPNKKTRDNIINAFINEVNAQAGKHISTATAALLIGDAIALLGLP